MNQSIVLENMGHTCDECLYYILCNGLCVKFHEYRHSCGEDACTAFELADDLKEE